MYETFVEVIFFFVECKTTALLLHEIYIHLSGWWQYLVLYVNSNKHGDGSKL
jgi:hypothetical protein